MTEAHLLFALTDSGPVELDVPREISDPSEVFDALPRGIYEALRTFDHVRFVGLAEHLDRAERSMLRFGLAGPLDHGALRAALHQVVSQFPGQDAKVRIDVLAGPAVALGTDSRVLIQATTLRLPPPEAYRDGVSAQLVEDLRRERPDVKEAQWVVDRRVARGGTPDNFEPILLDREGRLLEGIMSNLFAVRDGTLYTAPVSGVLPGVTRGLVLDLARALGLPCREQALPRDELHTLEEAFFSTSVRSVVPVVRIAGVTLGAGRPGPVTGRIMEAYRAHCAREARPAL